MIKRSHNKYDFCSCGLKKQERSPRCRKCFLADKESFTKHFKRIGFQPGYTPHNKGVKGVVHWSPELREKKRLFIEKNGGPMRGKNHTDAARKKTSRALMGDKAPNWRGGITPLNTIRRHSIEHKEWGRKVFVRDDYTCQICLRRGGRLEAHHIKPWRENKDIQFDMQNGITLCIPCHRPTTNRENLLVTFFQNLLIMGPSQNRVNSGNLFKEMEKLLRQS
jgi:hypothetical protein